MIQIDMERTDPDSWVVPIWHPDWDSEFELGHLRAFAKLILTNRDLDVRLDIIEKGCARLKVLSGDEWIGVVYVNRSEDPSKPLFGIFAGAEDEELQTMDAEEGIRFLAARKSPFAGNG